MPSDTNPVVTVSGPVIQLDPPRARRRRTYRDDVLAAFDRLCTRTGNKTVERHDLVAEVQTTAPHHDPHSIYRAIRRMSGHQTGGVHLDLTDLGDGHLRRR